MSNDDVERSESGNPIYRHKARTRDFSLPEHSCRHLDAIEKHVAEHLGEIETVYHEIISDLVHLDVLFLAATEERPFHVLITSGMSDEPMTVPEGMEELRYAELMIMLPPDWPLSEAAFKNEANYWPVRWLKQIGRLPHEYDTWIGWGHTIPNGDPAEKIANTGFMGVMVSPPYSLPAEFFELTTEAGDTIRFFQLVPLYQEEMDFKLKHGAEALEDKFEKAGISPVLDVKRKNVAKKTGWFG